MVAVNIPDARPVENFTLTDIKGDCARAMKLVNMTNVVLSGISVTGYQGALLTTTNVSGKGLKRGK